MNIPTHLMSGCADKTTDLCYGCTDGAKQDPDSGRWFITMGHPGFNSAANNRNGYQTQQSAEKAIRQFSAKKGR